MGPLRKQLAHGCAVLWMMATSLAFAGGDTSPRVTAVTPPPGALVDGRSIREIRVSFDEAVQVPLGAVRLRLGGEDPAGFGVSSAAELSVRFKFDPATDELVIVAPFEIDVGRVTLILDHAIEDFFGNALDGETGEASNPTLPSGDGVRGGRAVFRFEILQGDANRDGQVDSVDLQIIQAIFGACLGDPNYDPLADLNEDGCVNFLDFEICTAGQGGQLMPTDGVPPFVLGRDPGAGQVVRDLELPEITVEFDQPIEHLEPGSLFAVTPAGELQSATSVDLQPNGRTATFSFAPAPMELGDYRLQLAGDITDRSDALVAMDPPLEWTITLDSGPLGIESTSPFSGETGVALTRETIVDFAAPLGFVDPNAFFATFGGNVIPAMVFVSSDQTRVTLFYDGLLPASAAIRVTIIGDLLVDDLGNAVDADGDGEPGGIAEVDFGTLTLTTLPNTAVCGRVFASELGTAVGGEPVNVPLENVQVSVDGAEDTIFALTDNMGNFRLEPAPVGTFFVHIDGGTADVDIPPGAYYPSVGKPFTSVAGQEVNIGNVFLPLIAEGTLQPVSDTQDTVIEFPDSVLMENPELEGVSLTVPAGSLFANDGTLGGMAGIGPVDPARLPGELPDQLLFPLVITVQTSGMAPGDPQPTNFDVPAPVTFPNLPDPATGETLGPGEKTALWSFDHDVGRWAVVGSMTVSDDGFFVSTDPGVGIEAPGWHGVQPGFQLTINFIVNELLDGCVFDLDCDGLCDPLTRAAAAAMAETLSYCSRDGNFVAGSFCLSRIRNHVVTARALNNNAPCFDIDDPLMEPRLIIQDALPIIEDVYFIYIDAFQDNSGDFTPQQQVDLGNLWEEWDGTMAGGDVLVTYSKVVDNSLASYGNTGSSSPSLHLVTYQPFQTVVDSTSVSTFRNSTPFLETTENVRGTIAALNTFQTRTSLEDPLVPRYGFLPVESPPAGSSTQQTNYLLPLYMMSADATSADSRFEDSDFDGLDDFSEDIHGTNFLNPDSDGDGILDGAEVDQGTNPLDGFPVQIGISATAPVNGTAADIQVANNLAVVAGTTGGVSVYNVFNGMAPTIIAQVQTPGAALSVAIGLDRVAAACGISGLSIIDISDPPAAVIYLQIPQSALGSGARSVVVAGDLAIVGTDNGRLVVVDLVTGLVGASLQVAGSPIYDLSLVGTIITAVTQNDLYTIELASGGGALIALGTTSIVGNFYNADDRRRLYSDGDVALVSHLFGINIFDVSNPLAPLRVNDGNTPQAGWKAMALDGSGCAVGLQGPNSPFFEGLHDAHVYDLASPLDPGIVLNDQFQFSIPTPGVARSVDLFNGLAYVADHNNGIQVITYKPYDALGNAPSVSFTSSIVGNQLEEGSLVLFDVTATDDVQVRNVELLVNGTADQVDGNRPYFFFWRAPLLADLGGDDEITVNVEVSDTGGNTSTASDLTFTIVPDIFSPTVTESDPEEGDSVFGSTLDITGLSFLFSEALDETTVTPVAIELVAAGPDGTFDTIDDVLIPILSTNLAGDENTLSAAIQPDLVGEGLARVTLDGSLITDLAGNLLDGAGTGTPGTNFVVNFTILPRPVAEWSGFGDGTNWSDPANWLALQIPPLDSEVVIEDAGDPNVEHNLPGTQVFTLETTEETTITGGSLDVEVSGDFEGPLNITAGTLQGLGDLSAWDAFDWSGGTVRDPGRLSVLGDTTLDGSTKSLLDGRLIQLYGPATWTSGQMQASNGAVLDVFDLFTITTDADFVRLTSTVDPFFVNSGQVVKSGGAETIFTVPFLNLGTVEVQNGLLTLNNAGTSTADFFIAVDNTMQTSGNYGFDGNWRVLGGGSLRVVGPTSFRSPGIVNSTFVLASGGQRTGPGEIQLYSMFWEEGRFVGDGRTLVQGPAFITGGTSEIEGTHELVLNDTTSWDSGQIRVAPGASIRNNGNWVILTDQDVVEDFAGQNPPVLNYGFILKNSPGSTTFTGVEFNNFATLAVGQGTLLLAGGGTSVSAFDRAVDATLQTSTSYRLDGDWTVTGPGTLDLVGPTFFDTDGYVEGVFYFSPSGVRAGSATITLAQLLWPQGNFVGSGQTIAESALLTSTTKRVQDTHHLILTGTTVWDGGQMRSDSTAQVTNQGLFSVLTDQDWVRNLGSTDTQFVNLGTFRKEGTDGDLVTSFLLTDFVNQGTVEVLVGSLLFGSGGSSEGAFSIAPGTLVRTGGGFSFVDGWSSSGGGTLQIEGPTNILAPGTLTSGLVVTNTGVVVNTVPWFVDGDFDWQGGNIGGTGGQLTLNGNTTISANTHRIVNDQIVVVSGLAEWVGGQLRLDPGTRLEIPGTFETSTDQDVVLNTAGAEPVVSVPPGGVWRKTGTDGDGVTLFNGVRLESQGTVEVQAGTATFPTFYVSNNHIFFKYADASLAIGGNGQFDGTWQVMGDGDLQVVSNTDFLTPGSIDGGNFVMDVNGFRGGPATVTVNSVFHWLGGDFGSSGQTIIANDALLSNGTKRVIGTHSLVFNGNSTWLAGQIRQNPNAVVQNFGIFDVQTDEDWVLNIFGTTPVFTNFGTFVKTDGNGDNNTNFNGVAIDNQGTVEVQRHMATFNSGGQSSGLFVKYADASLRTGGGFDFDGNWSVVGDGSYQTLSTTSFNSPGSIDGGFFVIDANGFRSGPATVIVNSILNWSGGGFQSSGQTDVQGTANLTGTTKFVQGSHVLNLNGTTIHTGGQLRIAPAASVNNNGLYTFSTDADVVRDFFGSDPVFSNSLTGTLVKDAGGLTEFNAVDLVNSGTLDVQFGIIRCLAGGASTGTVLIQSGAALQTGGGFSFDGSWLVSGDGTLHLFTGNTPFLTGGTVNAPVEIDANAFRTGSAVVTLASDLDWDGGGFGSNGQTTVEGSTTLDGSTVYVSNTHSLDLAGTTTWQNIQLRIDPGATVTMSGDVDLQSDGDAIRNFFGSNPTVDLTGSLTKSGGAGISEFNAVDVTSSGTIDVQSGELRFSAGLDQTSGNLNLGGGTVSSGAATIVLAGGTLTGDGEVVGTVNNSGADVSPGNAGAGAVTVTGSYSQGASGILSIELGGDDPGTGYDQLVVTGTATLDGQVSVSLASGFQPTLGQAFDVVTWSTRSGTFSDVTLDLGNGTLLSATYLANSLRLEVIAVP